MKFAPLDFVIPFVVGLTTAGLAVGLFPRWLERHLPADRGRLMAATAFLAAVAAWTAFTFFQGTRYTVIACAEVRQVAEALRNTDLSVRQFTRGVGEVTAQLARIAPGYGVRPPAPPLVAKPVRATRPAKPTGGS